MRSRSRGCTARGTWLGSPATRTTAARGRPASCATARRITCWPARGPSGHDPARRTHHRGRGDNPAVTALDNLSAAPAIEVIGSLPPEQAEAALLRAVVGLGEGSAAHVIGKTAGAVRVAAHRDLKNLAKRTRGHGRCR
jgi:DNA-directed RNA polymerase specialized sigma24 family protein